MNSKFKYFAVALAFMFFGSALSAVAQEEIKYDNMFNNVEETEDYDVLTLAAQEENLSTFVRLVKEAGLETSIELAGPVTLLAPTNEAFEKLSKEQFEELTDPANRTMLTKVMQAHILPSKVYASEFEENQILETSDGKEVPVGTAGAVSPGIEPAVVVIGGASIIKSDVEATNGIIHVMDNIITPGETSDPTIGN